MIYKTLALKMLQPSKTKREIIDRAMVSYAVALEFLLANLKKSVDKQNKILIPKSLMDRLNAFHVEPFKDALRKDAMAVLASYLARKNAGKKVSYPKVYVDSYQCTKTLQTLFADFEEGKLSKKQLDLQLAKVFGKYGKPKTLFFCRNAQNRDFSLLYNPTTNKYYVKVYLLNYANAIPNPHLEQRGEPGQLVYLSPEQQPFCASSKKIRYLILPLVFGKWQEQYLQMAWQEKGVIKTARLVKKNNEYYLYINLQFQTAPYLTKGNYLGVIPAGKDSVSYAVVDQNKNLVTEGSLRAVGKNAQQVSRALAIKIAELSAKTQSQLVLYNPKLKSDIPLALVHWQLSVPDYSRLLAKIQQRCGEEKLPEPVLVSPRGLYTTCPSCQHNSKKNLMTEQLFICNQCGYSALVEKLGVYNLAARLLTYESKALSFHSIKEKDKIIITNARLGVKFITNSDFLYLKRFLIFLEQERERGKRVLAGEEKYNGDDYKQKYLLWRKLIALEQAGEPIEENIIIEG